MAASRPLRQAGPLRYTDLIIRSATCELEKTMYILFGRGSGLAKLSILRAAAAIAKILIE
jgi:hypothetical protein